MLIRFKLGIKKPTKPSAPYVATYIRKGSKIIITRMYRQRCKEELPPNAFVFTSPPARYGSYMFTDDTRAAIKEAATHDRAVTRSRDHKAM